MTNNLNTNRTNQTNKTETFVRLVRFVFVFLLNTNDHELFINYKEL